MQASWYSPIAKPVESKPISTVTHVPAAIVPSPSPSFNCAIDDLWLWAMVNPGHKQRQRVGAEAQDDPALVSPRIDRATSGIKEYVPIHLDPLWDVQSGVRREVGKIGNQAVRPAGGWRSGKCVAYQVDQITRSHSDVYIDTDVAIQIVSLQRDGMGDRGGIV